MEPSNSAFDSEILGVVLAQLLRCKLFQAIRILWLKANQAKINLI